MNEAQQHNAVVRRAAGGLLRQRFVRRCQALRPAAEELRGIIREEQDRREEVSVAYGNVR